MPEFVAYYALRDHPWLPTPTPTYAFATRSMQEGVIRMRDVAISRLGLGIISGVFGVGKSTNLQIISTDLSTRGAEVAVFENVPGNTRQTPASFLKDIADKLNLGKVAGNAAESYYNAIFEYAREVDADGSTVVLLIDEAHRLNKTGVRVIKDLQMMQSKKGQLVQVVLFGQTPGVMDILKTDPALHSRLGQHKELSPVSREEVGAMIEFRLKVAGREERLFTPAAVEAIARASGGNPRIVCRVAHVGCVNACNEKAELVDERHVNNVELEHEDKLV